MDILERFPRQPTACSAGRKRSWIIYCWLIWCERKILFWLKIYDRLRPSEQADKKWQNGWQTRALVSRSITVRAHVIARVTQLLLANTSLQVQHTLCLDALNSLFFPCSSNEKRASQKKKGHARCQPREWHRLLMPNYVSGGKGGFTKESINQSNNEKVGCAATDS